MAGDNMDLDFSAAQIGTAQNRRREVAAIEELSNSESELRARFEAAFSGEYTKALGRRPWRVSRRFRPASLAQPRLRFVQPVPREAP